MAGRVRAGRRRSKLHACLKLDEDSLLRMKEHGRVDLLLLAAAVLLVAVGAMTLRLGPGWPRRIFFRGPAGVVLHHTATAAVVEGQTVNAEMIARWHLDRGFESEYRDETYHIGYHYVILPDGTLQQGRPEWMPGAHTYAHNDHLGICLVGNFDAGSNPRGAQQPAEPTDAQMEALRSLLRDLMRKYRLRPDDIHGHGELTSTACPGSRFPLEALRQDLAESQ